MKRDKPFWERNINPITGYKLESFQDVKFIDSDYIRTYAMDGTRHARTTSKNIRFKTNELNECVILNDNE
jgi:hypothetical protein